MGPFAALDSVMSKYFTLKGRAQRSEYWWYQLMYFIILIAALSFDAYLYDPFQPISLNPFAYFTSCWLLVNIIPHFTVTVRRLHDTDKSGFWWLIGIVPFGWIVLLVFMILPSDPRENSYGPPPFGPLGSTYAGHDLNDVSLTGNRQATSKPHNPYAAYANLERARQPASPELIAARKEQVSALYQQRVLGNKPVAEG